MSKFLKIVEENRPLSSEELGKVTPLKRIFQRALLSESNKTILEDLGLVKVIVTDRSDDITLKFNDSTTVIFRPEVVKEEENEGEVISTARSIRGVDPNLDKASDGVEAEVRAKAPVMVPVLNRVRQTLRNLKPR